MVMLSDISVYHKIQSESMQFQERSFSINQLSDMCYDYANYLIAGKMISYMWVGELDGVYKGDQKRLSQVAFNLIENAVKHNRMGGSIRIEAEQKVEIISNDFRTVWGCLFPNTSLMKSVGRLMWRVPEIRARKLLYSFVCSGRTQADVK